jgi:hypothetical protein
MKRPTIEDLERNLKRLLDLIRLTDEMGDKAERIEKAENAKNN